MRDIKVYTHYKCENGIDYRWRTIIQIGDSWDIRGTIFMKNPGSSDSIESSNKSIEDSVVLEKLRTFDDRRTSLSCEWYEFSVDRTMISVINLFKAYYEAHGKQLSGVIQIFNLFNIRDANLWNAIDRLKGNIVEDLAFTTKYDIDHIVPPVYIGWGYIWKNPTLRKNAEEIFKAVKNNNSYLCDGIQNNKFYHPLYLMVYGKNREKCKEEMNRFKKIKL